MPRTKGRESTPSDSAHPVVPTPDMLPCPFCGSTVAEVLDCGPWWRVECPNCNAHGPHSPADDTLSDEENRAAAIEAWNEREVPRG